MSTLLVSDQERHRHLVCHTLPSSLTHRLTVNSAEAVRQAILAIDSLVHRRRVAERRRLVQWVGRQRL